MLSLLRNKRKIYVCKAIRQNNITKYEEPIKLYENYHVTNNDADLEVFGMDAYQMVRIKTDAERAKYYHLGDAVYINIEPPEEHDEMCKTADYEVCKEPVVTFNIVEVLLRRRSGRR